MNSHGSAALSASLCFLLIVPNCLCFPWFFKGCDGEHPSGPVLEHKAPEEDPETTIRLFKGEWVVIDFCPGESYSLTIGFPNLRHAMITCSDGAFEQNERDVGIECDMKRKTFANVTELFDVRWTAGCNTSDPVIFKVSSAVSPIDPFLFNDVEVPVSTSCKPTSC